MTRFVLLLPAAAALSFAVSASAANICNAPPLSCATTMPVGGYCECTAKGATHDGTVEARPAKGGRINSTAAGCGSNPNAPGCR
ncbi:MAG: hypothetical protein RQ966_13970 [Acetobacteraceae bacterium]|nr:hypothetical protein [Acetobacteraceae bacterium]